VDKLFVLKSGFFICKILYFGYSATIMTKRTYQPSKRKRARTHGFLVRGKTATGSTILRNRRRKGRTQLSVSK